MIAPAPGIDVVFLKPPLTVNVALAHVSTREGVDRVWSGTGVLYVERLAARPSQSRLSRISSPVLPSMTIRTWRTTTELLRLLEGAGLSRRAP